MTTASLIDYESPDGEPVSDLEIVVDDAVEVIPTPSDPDLVTQTVAADSEPLAPRDPALAVFYFGILSLLIIIATSGVLAL